jgi:hypothetical protein
MLSDVKYFACRNSGRDFVSVLKVRDTVPRRGGNVRQGAYHASPPGVEVQIGFQGLLRVLSQYRRRTRDASSNSKGDIE